MNWDEFFMRHVYLASSKSKDTSTKIGAILVRDKRVISEGYNGMPEGVNDNVAERYVRPTKYEYFEHGERNAVFGCAKFGIPSKGAVLYTNGIPCADCARACIQAGISEIVVHKQWEEAAVSFVRERWDKSCSSAEVMLAEAGIPIRRFDGILGVASIISGKEVNV